MKDTGLVVKETEGTEGNTPMVATVWHEGTQSFYEAILDHKVTLSEALLIGHPEMDAPRLDMGLGLPVDLGKNPCNSCTHCMPDAYSFGRTNPAYLGHAYANMCAAPQLVEYMDVTITTLANGRTKEHMNTFIACQDARDIKFLCGTRANWFQATKREAELFPDNNG